MLVFNLKKKQVHETTIMLLSYDRPNYININNEQVNHTVIIISIFIVLTSINRINQYM